MVWFLARCPAAMYPSSLSPSNSKGVIGPGLPAGNNLGLIGCFLTAIVPAMELEAALFACAIMSRWYACIFFVTSDVFLTCVGRSLVLLLLCDAGIERLVGGIRRAPIGDDTCVLAGD